MFTKAIGCLYSLLFCQVIVKGSQKELSQILLKIDKLVEIHFPDSSVCITMSLSQSRRAINERRRRVSQREKRRRSVFVHDYIRTKYVEIYNECNGFYQNLCEKHPRKLDQTKTKEYRDWKKKILDGNQSESATGKTSDGNQSESDSACEAREAAVVIENICGESTVTTTNYQEPPAEPSILQIAAQELLPTNPITIEEMDEIVAEPSILQIAAQELLPTNPMTIEEMDEIVGEIIRELEEDEQIRDLVPDISSDDEGIEINIDTELDAILEPFDYEIEVEGADW